MLQSKKALLEMEGLSPSQITLEKDQIVETEDGFISWRMEHGYPYMAHYITRHPRTFEKAFNLYKKFRDEIGRGREFLAEVTPDKPYIERFIRFVDRDAVHYATINGIKYFLLRAKR